VLSKLGADVVATDLQPNLKLLERNVQENAVAVRVAEHTWGAAVDDLSPPFDVVVACGVLLVDPAAGTHTHSPLAWPRDAIGALF